MCRYGRHSWNTIYPRRLGVEHYSFGFYPPCNATKARQQLHNMDAAMAPEYLEFFLSTRLGFSGSKRASYLNDVVG